MESVKSIVEVLREPNAELKRSKYLQLVAHRVSKKRFGRLHSKQRGGARWGSSYEVLREQGFAYEIQEACKLGFTQHSFVRALIDANLSKVIPDKYLVTCE